jgi:PST family polysaccharide transporter
MGMGRPEDPAEDGETGATALARSALRGGFWVGAAQLTGKLVFFVSTVVLARLLEQQDFGVAAYAITVIALCSAFPTLGLGPALIHYDDDQSTLSTGFWLGILAGLTGFALVWIAAPLTVEIFGDERAVGVTRGLAFVFPLESLRNVHATLLRKRLEFRSRFVPELLQSVTKGAVAIAMAVLGFGPWSLIGGVVAAAAVGVPAYWIASGWRPTLEFDLDAARRLVPFGGHVMSIGLLGAVVRNLDNVLVGRLLGAATLGVYVLAFRIPDLLVRNLAVMVGQVLLPTYAKAKNDPAVLRTSFLASNSYVFALTAPLSLGLAIAAEPLVITLFSERWRPVVAVIPPICLYALFISVSFNVGDMYKALGRPEVLTRLSLLRVAIAVPALWFAAAVLQSAAAVAWTQAAIAFVATTINLWVAAVLFQLPIRELMTRWMPVVGASAVMGLAAAGVRIGLADESDPIVLVATTLAGVATYLVALRWLAPEFVDGGAKVLMGTFGPRRPAAVRGAG